MQMTELFERFFAMEMREDLFSRQIGGVPYWHLVRMRLFNDILRRTFSLKPAHPDLTPIPPPRSIFRRVLGKLCGAWRRALDLTVCNPALVLRHRPVLVSMTPRQAVLADGRRVSLLLDFFAPRLRSRYALLEHVLVRPTRQPFGRKVLHLPRMGTRFEKCRRSGWFADTEDARRSAANDIAARLTSTFGVSVDAEFVRGEIDGALLFREVHRPVLRRMLCRLRTKLVVTAVHYNLLHFTLAEVAHEMGIPVAELQHGSIYSSHPAYNLPETASRYSPDYILSWGDYWNRQMRNYPNRRSVSVGYPYLEHFRLSCGKRPHDDQRKVVLFISQANVADELIGVARELRNLVPEEMFRIVYKLHPNESRDWRCLYPQLAESRVEVVSNRDRNIYECLAEADIVVGDCSTALIEGLAWGVRTFVMHDMPAADTMHDFVACGAMAFVHSAADLAEKIRMSPCCGNDGASQVDDLFKMPDAAARIATFIESQIAEKSPSP